MDDRVKVAIAALAVGAVVVAAAYTHTVREETRVAGLMFGNSILDIQDDLKAAQNAAALRLKAWESGKIDDAALLEYYDGHAGKMDALISRYDSLEPPPGFDVAVSLFRLSAESQRDSDAEFVLWVRGGEESNLARSGELLQDAFEYESEALAAFNDAKLGRIR